MAARSPARQRRTLPMPAILTTACRSVRLCRGVVRERQRRVAFEALEELATVGDRDPSVARPQIEIALLTAIGFAREPRAFGGRPPCLVGPRLHISHPAWLNLRPCSLASPVATWRPLSVGCATRRRLFHALFFASGPVWPPADPGEELLRRTYKQI